MSTRDRRTFLRQVAGGMAALTLHPDLLPAAPGLRGRAPLKLAVVGIGRQGRRMLSELAKIEAVEVAAVCDTRDVALRRAARRAPDAEAFSERP